MNKTKINPETILKPETPLERQIIADPEFQEGLFWGKPRRGHPEGEVIHHIADVLKNINDDAPNNTSEQNSQLRLIALIHDTFKYKVDQTKRKVGDNHHGYFARKFAEKYITDPIVLDIIEKHDDAYNIYRRQKNVHQAIQLIKALGDHVYLYLAFYWCDSRTGNKESDPYEWFETVAFNFLRDSKYYEEDKVE